MTTHRMAMLLACLAASQLAALPVLAAPAKASVATLRSQGQSVAASHLPELKSKSEAAAERFKAVQTLNAPKAAVTLPSPPAPGQVVRHDTASVTTPTGGQ
jgi:hypothetical protein